MNIIYNIVYGVDTSILILFGIVTIVTIAMKFLMNQGDIRNATQKFRNCTMPIMAEVIDIKASSRKARNASNRYNDRHRVSLYTITVKYDVLGDTFENTCVFDNPSKINIGDQVKIKVNPKNHNDITGKHLDLTSEGEVSWKYTKSTLIWCLGFIACIALILVIMTL